MSRRGAARGRVETVLWYSILVTIAVTPLLVAPPGRDMFRVPKTAFFDSAMLIIGAAGAAWLLFRRVDPLRLRPKHHRLAIGTAAAAVLWTAVSTLAAVNPVVARFAPLAALTCAIAFVATLALARGTLLPLAVLLVPAAANAVATALQDLKLWSPVRLMETSEARVNTTGLLGNPDYVAAYLIVPCVAALCAAMAFRRYRFLFLVTVAVLVGGILFTRSATGIIATGTAFLAFALSVRSWRTRALLLAGVAALAIAVLSYTPTRTRAVAMAEHVREGRWMEFSSFRLPAFAVAVAMFGDRPLLGVGPGGYEAKYMSYKVANDERFPQWLLLGNTNFGEAHNDYLQLLAETGVPGLVLFLLALAQVAALSFRRRELEDERGHFSRLFGFPAAVGFGMAALAQFPLHLTACTATAVFAAALALAWSRGAAAASAAPHAVEAAESPSPATPISTAPGADRTATAPPFAVAIGVAVCAVAVACVVAYRVGWLRYRAEVVKKRAEDRLYLDYTSDHTRRAVARAVMDELAPWLRRNPADYQLLFLAAVAAANSERKAQAIALYEQALALNERPEIYTNMAVLQLERGEVEAARRNVMRACTFNLGYAQHVAQPLNNEIMEAMYARQKRLQERVRIEN